MNRTETIALQTGNAYAWVNKLLDSVPYDKWEITPNVLETNTSWQAGHLIMSVYYNAVMVISGHQMDVIQQVPLKEYDALFTNAAAINCVSKAKPEDLRQQLAIVQDKSLAIIRSLADAELESRLTPTETPHPIASTKFEALDWNIKHAMYHCGQLGILKRIVDKRYDFGLRKA